MIERAKNVIGDQSKARSLDNSDLTICPIHNTAKMIVNNIEKESSILRIKHILIKLNHFVSILFIGVAYK